MARDVISASDMEILEECQNAIDYQFKRRDLLRAALTHTSSADTRLASNERLEFLGDAVLGLVVCEQLFRLFPEYQEGDLTKVKSAVVSRRTCARISKLLNLGDYLFLGKGMHMEASMPANLLAERLRVAGRGHLSRRRAGSGSALYPQIHRPRDRGSRRRRSCRQLQVAPPASRPARVQRDAAVFACWTKKAPTIANASRWPPSSKSTPLFQLPGAATKKRPSKKQP